MSGEAVSRMYLNWFGLCFSLEVWGRENVYKNGRRNGCSGIF